MSLAAFRIWFPKHVLRIDQTLLLPIGCLLAVFTNFVQFYWLLNWLPPLTGEAPQFLIGVLQKFLEGGFWSYSARCLFMASFFVTPAIATLVIGFVLRRLWDAAAHTFGDDNVSVWYLPGRKIGELLLNHMAILSAYDPRSEELMVDVYTHGGFLYCGIYSDYFIDKQGKFSGLSIRNSIRFRIAHENSTGKRLPNDAYVIPNQGEILFPDSHITNCHIWRMRDGHVFAHHLQSFEDASVLAWNFAIQFVSRITVRVKILGQSASPEYIDKFIRELRKLKLDAKDIHLEHE